MNAETWLMLLGLLVGVLVATIFWGPAAGIFTAGIIIVAMCVAIYAFGDRLVRLADEMFEEEEEG